MEGEKEINPEKLDKLGSGESAEELFRSLAFIVDGGSDATTIFDCKKMAQHIEGNYRIYNSFAVRLCSTSFISVNE
jgi:hypothetical protein